MMVLKFVCNTMLVVALLAVMGVMTIRGAEPVTAAALLAQEEVTQRDELGRVEMLKTYADNGMCMTSITYGNNEVMFIDVFIVPTMGPSGIRSISVKIRNGDHKHLSDAVLMRLVRFAVKHYCLPKIVPGWVVS